MYRIPKHIGIIPDGNRRWATQHGLNKEDGYEYGLSPGVSLLRYARQKGVKELTYYGFTVDNCKRPKEQVTAFAEACLNAVKMIENEDVYLRVVGNTKPPCFPAQLLEYTINNKPCDESKMKVNFLVNYGWEWDRKKNWAAR